MRIKKFLALIALFMVSACATQPVVERPPELYWPLPPEKPRIKFVDTIIGSLDAKSNLEKMKSFFAGSSSETKFVKPFGIAAQGGKMYVTDIGGIHSYDFAVGQFDMLGTDDLRVPTGIAISGERLFVGDVARKKVYGLDIRSGKVILEMGRQELDSPAGLAVDEKRKRLVVADARKHKIFVYSTDGILLFSFGTSGSNPGEFVIPYAVAVDHEGRIYVVDSGNFRVQIFDEKGTYIKSIGQIGMSPGTFARPKGIALDSEGHIYVLDAAFGNFQIFDYDGNTLLAVGTSGNGPAEFMLPSSIYIDDRDQIFIVDQLNKRVQLFQYLK
ncbi:MAG: 6-bladed beta-propeller [Nitrospirae bacterium]|nr:6-bladed beta-propeller [Nitrospirota bacterium]